MSLKTVLLVLGIGVLLVTGLIVVAGVVLVAMGASGNSTISFFGQSIETTVSGIAAIFCGSVIVVIVIPKVLKTMEKLLKNDGLR